MGGGGLGDGRGRAGGGAGGWEGEWGGGLRYTSLLAWEFTLNSYNKALSWL